ncbi:hypothetical protein [Paenibacillus harenae]|uniref:Lipoprotein n=1 Tax=Paenibacillus harenae TaxID=306543 RepID=A0ABT9U5K6_PAEHA|nr:hypothetical protein [Paenibacillus harenae]MDQ0114858.1 hypothetical protein [Paenibacillus harenae]
MRTIATLLVVSLFSSLLAGCGSFYTGISKNTVMVKKTNQEKPDAEVEYGGLLSEDTVKTLSVNAVNKYFGHNLSLDDAMIDTSSLDQQQIKAVLADATSEMDMKQGFLVEYREQLIKVAGGIYMSTIINKYDSEDMYGVVMNAKDGEVIGLSKVNIEKRTSSPTESKKYKLTEVVGLAEQFIETMGDYEQDALEWDDSYYLNGYMTELYFKNKETDEVALSLLINIGSGEVVGFYKDIMTVLQLWIGKRMYSTSVQKRD